MADVGEGKKEEESKKIVHTYPLVRVSWTFQALLRFPIE